MKTTKSFSRCQNLKAKNFSPEFVAWYDDLQEDYRKCLKLFFEWAAIPHGIESDKGVTYISSEDAAELRKLSIGNAKKEKLATQFIELLLKGGVAASSCYNVFYKDYKSSGKAKKTPKKMEFISKLPTLTAEELALWFEKDPQLAKIPEDQWKSYGEKIDNGMSLEKVWDEVSSELADTDRQIGSEVRKAFNVECKRGGDTSYCRILIEMVGRDLRSIFEKCNTHLADTEELKEYIAKNRSELSDLLGKFASALNDLNYGLSQVVLEKSIQQITNPKPGMEHFRISVDELKKPEWSALIAADHKTLKSAYSVWREQCRLEKRRIYPCFNINRKDYKVMVGQGSLGVFDLEVVNDHVLVSIRDVGNMLCLPSCYFSGLVLDELRSSSGRIGYGMKFRHKAKGKNPKYSREVQGEVKEIGIRKKGEDFFVSLSYTIKHDELNFKIAQFFATASPDQKLIDQLPDEIKVAAFDLNISNPVCGTKALLKKNGSGNLIAADYGKGKIVEEPSMLIADGHRCKPLIDLKYKMLKAKKAIREYKACKRIGEDVCSETRQFLESVGSAPSPVTRSLIQTWIKDIRLKLSKFKYDLRHEGYGNLAEAIRLLECMDSYASMIDSYDRMHLKPGEQLPKKPKFDERRANFRKHITRRIAATIAEYSHDCNVVFIENLDFKFDSDKDNNSLNRLFSSATLKKFIVEALEKLGIAVVEVDKSGTSKTDPVTGNPCWRDFENKERLYTIRDGRLGWVNSDLAASLNVLIRGLTHSICPYKFFIPKRGKKSEEDRPKKRLDRFFKSLYGTASPKFVVDEQGRVTGVTKMTSGQTILEGKYVYAHNPSGIVTWERQFAIENKIKELVKSGMDCVEFDVTSGSSGGYRNFSIDQIRDLSQIAGNKKVPSKSVNRLMIESSVPEETHNDA